MSTQAATESLWYFVHTYSGQEDRVKKNLEQRIATMDMRGKIFQVVVPTEEVVEIKEGKRIPKRVRLYPGYIMVQMSMDDESWYVVRNTPGVTGFISAEDEKDKRAKPVPLESWEVANILKQIASETPKTRIGFTKGRGKIEWADEKSVVEKIKKLFPDQAAVLVKTVETVRKKALGGLKTDELKRLGCIVREAGDYVYIAPVDDQVEKLVKRLLKEDAAGEDAED